MFQVQCLQSKVQTSTDHYSKYSIGPFIKGQSTTVGNTLRRVLLSNLQGLAIIGVRITGINHEFSNVPNVKEDGTTTLLIREPLLFTSCTKGLAWESSHVQVNIGSADMISFDDIIIYHFYLKIRLN